MDERDPDRDQHHRQHEAAEAGEPAEQLLDPATERSGQVQVDRQAEQQSATDETDADELVLTALDRPAKSLCARARRFRAVLGGVASRTPPRFAPVVRDVRLVAPVPELVRFCGVFFDGPHVVMAAPTVPRAGRPIRYCEPRSTQFNPA